MFGPGNTCAKRDGSGGQSALPAGRAHASKCGRTYAPRKEKVVENARKLTEDQWNTLSVQSIPHRTVLQTNEETLKTTNRPKAFREGIWEIPANWTTAIMIRSESSDASNTPMKIGVAPNALTPPPPPRIKWRPYHHNGIIKGEQMKTLGRLGHGSHWRSLGALLWGMIIAPLILGTPFFQHRGTRNFYGYAGLEHAVRRICQTLQHRVTRLHARHRVPQHRHAMQRKH